MQGITGNRWKTTDVGDSDLLNHILRVRGITEEQRGDFLKPKVKAALPDPFFLLGMKESARRLADDIIAGKKIGIFSDYDADGATSAGVLGRWVRSMGNPHHHLVIPDRKEHGYGPHAGLITDMFSGGSETVFVLDSGTVAAPVLNPLPKDMRQSIFIIDHHMPFGESPEVGAVVNPNLVAQTPGLGHMAACGVTFLLCVAAQRELVKAGHLPKESMQDLMKLLDYVAIGTVCDVVPLVGVNRAMVSLGLQMVDKSETNPIGALLTAAGRNGPDPVLSSDCGFVIGPRLNAEGRIGLSTAAAEFLLEEDPQKIKEGAKRLHETNLKRQAMEKEATEVARANADIHARKYAVIAVTDGHEGVVGICASRLKDDKQTPAIVLTSPEPGILKGSARSVDGFNIGEAIHKAHDLGLILKGGGHGMAGGLTMEADKLEALRDFLNEEAMNSDFGRNGITTEYDAKVSADDIHVEAIRSLSPLQPYGRSNPEPRFIIAHAQVKEVSTMKDVHIKIRMHSRYNPYKTLDALMWNGVGTPAGDLLLAAAESDDDRITIAGRVEIKVYKGKESVQMIIEDVLDPTA